MADFTLDVARFNKRMGALIESWSKDNTDEGVWAGADVLVVATGKSSSEASKDATLQMWLFDVELPDTAMMVTLDKKVMFLASAKKVAILRQLDVGGSPFSFTFLEKIKGGNAGHYEALLAALPGSRNGKNIGFCGGAAAAAGMTGKLVKGFFEAVQAGSVPFVDIDAAVSAELVIKDADEIANIRKAAALSDAVFAKVTVKDIEKVLDAGSAVTHIALANKAAVAFTQPGTVGMSDLDSELADVAHPPSIQSGSKVVPDAVEPDTAELASRGAIIISMGGRYDAYSASETRTLMVNPSAKMKKLYEALCDAHEFCIKAATPGKTFSALYQETVAHVSSKSGELAKLLPKALGSSIGLDVTESRYVIAETCTARIKAGMVLRVATSFRRAVDKKSRASELRKFSLALADTVLVGGADGAEELTKGVARDATTYVIDAAAPSAAAIDLDPEVVLEDRFRSRGGGSEHKSAAAEAELAENQRKLAEETMKAAMERYAADDKDASRKKVLVRKVHAYDSPSHFPRAVRPDAIFVDLQAEVVFLPVHGVSVPFAATTIKSATRSDEENFSYVRINFLVPTGGASDPHFPDPSAVYIKEVAFRVASKYSRNLNQSLRQIQELRKRIQARMKDRRLRADLVKQDKLRLTRSGAIPRLSEVQMRPKLTGRKEVGNLSAHENGLRFESRTGQRVDIIYNNIRHVVFQPADNELIVLIHFHLHNDIMVGKKKTKDIQFYQMAYNVEKNLSGRGNAMDAYELEDEQRERQLRAKKNKTFKRFAEALSATVEAKTGTELDVEMPFRDLGFFGVPERTTVFMAPTVSCLVNVAETPFVVISLDDVEIAYLERVRYSLRNWDLVLVFKDYSRPVQHINSIEAKALEPIKAWLTESRIAFYEGPTNLNWKAVMEHINSDISGFFADGGWSFLDAEDEAEDEVVVSEGSEFEPSDDGDGDFGEDSYEFDSGEIEYDSEDFDPEEELSEAGLSDDELEAEARRQDMKTMKRGRVGADVSSRPRKKSKRK